MTTNVIFYFDIDKHLAYKKILSQKTMFSYYNTHSTPSPYCANTHAATYSHANNNRQTHIQLPFGNTYHFLLSLFIRFIT